MSARVLVVGGGAIGGVTAAHLARAGRDVTVLDANAEHVARLSSPGLELDFLGTEVVVPITAVTDPAGLGGRYDFALITLKATFLEDALGGLERRGVVDDYVSLGNGLVHDRIERLVGAERLLLGITEWGGTNLGPGRLAHTTRAPFVVGEPSGEDTERVRRLADALSPVAEVLVSSHIRADIWSKLLINSTFSGLGAVSGGLYRDVAEDPLGRRLAYRVWTEGYDVASATGARLPDIVGVAPTDMVLRPGEDEARASAAVDTVMARLAATKASMLQDLERGVRTEVDVINGGVVSTAERLGMPAPANAAIVDYVRDCEAGRRVPEPAAFKVIADRIGLDG